MSIDPALQYRYVKLALPDGQPVAGREILLHSCCAPCSGAVVECLLRCGARPTVYFSNSNIYPYEEYAHRRAELERFLRDQGVPWVEDDYDHEAWRHDIRGLELAPERGERCTICFRHRLLRAAQWGAAHGFGWLTTTLASSRWKDLQQVNEAGEWATAQTPGISYWPQDWRKGGLQLRRSALIKFYHFYNQPYCGCEMSLAQTRARMAQRDTATTSCQALSPDDIGGE